MADYINGVQVQGTPKTVQLEMIWKGVKHSAPLQVCISALIYALTDDQKTKFFGILEKLNALNDMQTGAARVVADIPTPIIQP